MRTVLYEEHVRLGARMTLFAGWEMPLLYEGIVREHMRTREACSVFDTCHMGVFKLSGPAAAADLDRLLTQPIASMTAGRCSYGYMLAENGGVIDDLTCFRLADAEFLLVVNAGTREKDAAWIRNRISGSTAFEDRSGATAKLDIQGPLAGQAMEACFGTRPPELKFFEFREVRLGGADCLLSRSGYTGEFGYELFLPAGFAAETWRNLLASKTAFPAGLGARDTLRFEMGYPLYGHELSLEFSPAGAARGKFIDLNKNFIGKDAVAAELRLGTADRLVGLRFPGRMAARAGDPVFAKQTSVGRVTSGMFAPSLETAAALAYVPPEFACPGAGLSAVSRGKTIPAEVSALPLYTGGTCRRK